MLTGQLVLFQGINRFNNHPGLFGIFLSLLADRTPIESGRPLFSCGPDGTRTRDLRRDRAAF